jgi:hypothetical protein
LAETEARREKQWSPNPDHYPLLNMDGGKLVPWNVRLAHVVCNNIDYSLRKWIREALKDRSSLSFGEMAERLNKKKGALKQPGGGNWTAESLRRTYVR